MKHQNTYTSKDIYLSAYLYAVGVPLESFVRAGGITTFQFTSTDELNTLVQNYYADRTQVSALRLMNGFKSLKSMIYQSEYNTHANMSNNTGKQS